MLSFTLTGTVSSVLTNAPDETTLVLETLVARTDAQPRLSWILCSVRDADPRKIAAQHLRQGDQVRVDGEIEQHRRQVGELGFFSLVFIARKIERLPEPITGAGQ
ncbi:hypothetical protein [Vitreimonas flagellata]|uniref:hypothetical protein n=1 Tax=Vitreimonas flagellata TaxID=2560861 RepID=UPI00143210EE|nr:hypothetical protein [Vitreimonas flagellata]